MQFFESLGLRIKLEWLTFGNNNLRLPEVASRALLETPPSEHVSWRDIVDWSLSTHQLTPQSDINGDFGQPPLTVFSNDDFRIEVLFWLDGHPEIHEHGFSGAFHVLHGSSLHTNWSFTNTEEINSKFYLGKMQLEKSEILTQGDTREIIAGRKLIHTTYHLDRPTVTVVVRTHQDIESQPQLSYSYPSIGHAPEHKSHSLRRRLQILKLLSELSSTDEYQVAVEACCNSSDPYSAYYYLRQAYQLITEPPIRRKLLSSLRRTHPDLIRAIEPSLHYANRQRGLSKLRGELDNPKDRFVAALLITIPTLPEILNLLRKKYPYVNPITPLVDCIKSLSIAANLGLDDNKQVMDIVTYLLSGLSDPEITQELLPTSQNSTIIKDETDIANLVSSLRKVWILEPLLNSASLTRI